MSDVERRTRLDYELAREVHADTPARMKALGDPLRQAILDLVLERAMSVTELAERLRRPKGSVAYHVKVLVEAELLQVVRTQKVRALEERFYGRSALTIVFPHSPGEMPFIREVLHDIDLDRSDDEAASAFTFRRARISRERAEEYRDRLYELSLEFVDEPRAGDVEYGMYVALFPTVRQFGPSPDEEPS
jgi:DNA-binding transcriptional ArsR family regulator